MVRRDVCVSDSCALIPRGFASSPFRLLNGNLLISTFSIFFSISFRNCRQAITNGDAIQFTFVRQEFLILIREILSWTGREMEYGDENGFRVPIQLLK